MKMNERTLIALYFWAGKIWLGSQQYSTISLKIWHYLHKTPAAKQLFPSDKLEEGPMKVVPGVHVGFDLEPVQPANPTQLACKDEADGALRHRQHSSGPVLSSWATEPGTHWLRLIALAAARFYSKPAFEFSIETFSLGLVYCRQPQQEQPRGRVKQARQSFPRNQSQLWQGSYHLPGTSSTSVPRFMVPSATPLFLMFTQNTCAHKCIYTQT